MSDTRWTLDPAIDAFVSGMTMPSPDFMQKLAAERAPLEAAAPGVGDAAPAFSVERLTPGGELSEESVALSDFRGRNLALQFGSYTCPIYRGQIARFNEIFDRYGDDYAFLTIYTSEAHPEDGWQVGINHAQNVVYSQPCTLDERAAIATDCMQAHGMRMPFALDDMNDTAEKLYAASPERLYVIDGEGIVRHRSVPGPFQMSAIDEWEAALAENIVLPVR